jgi:hypothetical protein
MERSLVAAACEEPILTVLGVSQDGSLVATTSLPESGSAAEAALIAQLFALLTSFVGVGLIHSVVVNVWPDFPVQASEPS